ncbi:unnamed protein product [Haemonchus placei]|uniref:Uncharacterized protein n=1 Tax=Haemonchus placei TaxID=6290 RepID=A0A3P7YXK1_HAEPC|nr:unnamed protein product [Haemonchus placei]
MATKLSLVNSDSFSVWGRGINSEGIRVGDVVPVHIDVKGPTAEVVDDLSVQVFADDGAVVPVKQQKKGSRSTFLYSPAKVGGHSVHVANKLGPIGQSPYKPKEPGIYKVNVLAGGEHITDSPFVLEVEPTVAGFYPSAAQLVCLDNEINLTPGEPASFQIDTRNAGACGDAPLVEVFDEDLNLVPLSGSPIDDGIYGYSFVPKSIGKHHIVASLRGVAIPGSPFPVHVRNPIDVSKLRIYGPGVDGPVKSQEPTHFTIDAKQAGSGAVEGELSNAHGIQMENWVYW